MEEAIEKYALEFAFCTHHSIIDPEVNLGDLSMEQLTLHNIAVDLRLRIQDRMQDIMPEHMIRAIYERVRELEPPPDIHL